MSILLNGLMVVARPADVGVKDRNCVGAGRISGLAVELVVEDRAHRAVGQGADLDGAHRCCFETLGAEWPDQWLCYRILAQQCWRILAHPPPLNLGSPRLDRGTWSGLESQSGFVRAASSRA